MRARLWPNLDPALLWDRRERSGFTTIPRGMPLMLDIMNDMANGQPVGATYLELWCRMFDEGFVTLSSAQDMAFHAGFGGQRAVRTWRSRMEILQTLGFIDIKPGSYGAMSYALVYNPYLVIKRHHRARTPGLVEQKFNALMQRAIDIGADDLDDLPDEEAIEEENPF
jgi:hypothetical protein